MVYNLRLFFSPLQNAVCFIILTFLVPVLFTFNIQDVLKLKKNSGAKRLISVPFRLYLGPSGVFLLEVVRLNFVQSVMFNHSYSP